MSTAASLSGGPADRRRAESPGRRVVAIEHIYPATGRPNVTVPLAGAAEIDRAVASARDAQRAWMSLTVDRRRDVLIDLADVVHEHLDELAAAQRARLRGADLLRGYRAHARMVPAPLRRLCRQAARRPVLRSTGRSTSISSSGSPTASSGSSRRGTARWRWPRRVWRPRWRRATPWCFKPSELAPLAALRFGELCVEAGLPAGLVNVVPAGAEGGEALVRHPGIRKIHFTGGDATARAVLAAAAANLTPVVAELGGKSANIVFEDADLDRGGRAVGPSGPADAVRAELRVREPRAGPRIGVRRVRREVPRASSDRPRSVTRSTRRCSSARSSADASADRILGVIDDAVAQKLG